MAMVTRKGSWMEHSLEVSRVRCKIESDDIRYHLAVQLPLDLSLFH